MNENPLTHNQMKQDGSAGRQRSLLIGAVALGTVVVLSICYAVYAYQRNRQLSTDLTNKNNQIAELQKQTTPTKTTPTNQPTTDPYAGWQSATLKYEKLSFKYPSTWTLTNSSTPGGTSGLPQTPGIDNAKLVSPTGLTLVIDTGDAGGQGGPYFGTVLSTTPIATLGGSYYLGFGTGGVPNSTTTTMGGSIGTTTDNHAVWPLSKNVTSRSSDPLYNIISMFYSDSTGNAAVKPVSAFQEDASYGNALSIIKSLRY